MINLTNRQARQFMLLKHGLLGEYKFAGKSGVLNFVRQAGCIQYDPIDICGKNSELTLQSRVKGFTKEMLDELLYKDRLLVDYPDKNTSIILTEDWPYFERQRQSARRRANEHPELIALMEQALAFIGENGVSCPDDMTLVSDFKWRAFIVWSSGKNLSGSVMEQLYGVGDLIIHHKNGSRKFYDLSERHIPVELLNAADPLDDELKYVKWVILRRIGAVGLLWNRPSDVFWRGRTDDRNNGFSMLLDEGRITAAAVDGLKDTLYFRSEDMPLMDFVLNNPKPKPRCELLAPLDCFLWDRKLIKALFGFEYTWEIYTPAVKRKYGHYVLPLLWGENFVGRVEAIAERQTKTLAIKNIWYEDNVKQSKKLQSELDKCMERFAKFNNCIEITVNKGLPQN